jgi:hypothetical protein
LKLVLEAFDRHFYLEHIEKENRRIFIPAFRKKLENLREATYPSEKRRCTDNLASSSDHLCLSTTTGQPPIIRTSVACAIGPSVNWLPN